jgi:signal peptidase II
VKLRNVALIIALIIVVDQVLKIWIKTHYSPGPVSNVIGTKFQLYFVENSGMAWGWKFGNEAGKIVLTLFRLAAVIFGTWYLGRIVRHNYHRGFIVCAALIYAGALGNLLDSMFYGMIFDKGMHYDPQLHDFTQAYSGVASLTFHGGYSSFLHGSVVDMLYFPLIRSTFPGWLPFVGGKEFEFFSPIFNIADASISVGVITLLLFQKRFFKRYRNMPVHSTVETSTEVSDKVQVS